MRKKDRASAFNFQLVTFKRSVKNSVMIICVVSFCFFDSGMDAVKKFTLHNETNEIFQQKRITSNR